MINNTGAGTLVPSSSIEKNGTKVPAPEGYKQTKAGVIPEDWDVEKLGDLCDKKAKYGINAPAVQFDKNLPVYLRITDIDERGRFSPEKISSVDDKDYENFILDENELVFARTGATVGKSYLYDNKDGELVYAGFLIKVSPDKNKLNSIFLKNYVDTAFYWGWVKVMSVRSGQPGINAEEYSLLPISLPPLKEQQKIAKILTTWDDAISKQEALIKAKEGLKKGLMQKLLSGEVRFEEFGAGTSVPLNSIEKNGTKVPAPGEWEEVRFNVVFERVTRKNTINNTNVLTISAQHGLINQEEFFNKSVASKDLSGYILLKNGEFAYNKSYSNGYPMGAVKRLNRYEQGVLSSLYIYFTIKDGDSDFYEHYFEAGFLNKEIYKIAQEGARNHGLLNMSVVEFFNDMHILKPSLEEQEKIAEVLTISDKEIDLLKNELEALKEQKRGLMQRLLSGEVRVLV